MVFRYTESDQLFFLHYTLNKRKKAGLNFYKEEHTKNYLISRVGYRISFAKNPESHPQPYVWNNSVQPVLTPGREHVR